MPFKKGRSGNPKGKQPGTRSRKVLMWEDLGEYLIKGGADRFIKVIKKSSDKDFIYAYEKLLNYFKPKLAQESHKIEQKSTIEVRYVDDVDPANKIWE